MKTPRRSVLVLFVAGLVVLAAAIAASAAPAAAPGPVIIHKSSFALGVGSGDYELLQIIQDFPPQGGVPDHQHGGHVLVTVLSGEMTLREKGGERVIKTGESWSESPGAIHSVVNAGTETARVVVSILLPKGAEVTTLVK